MEHSLFKIEYDWYEGEHGETLVSKNVKAEEFEKDLIEAKDFALSLRDKKISEGNYLGKGYRVECLGEYYEQIIWFLVNKKEYTEIYYDQDIGYKVDDFNSNKIEITKFEKTINSKEL